MEVCATYINTYVLYSYTTKTDRYTTEEARIRDITDLLRRKSDCSFQEIVDHFKGKHSRGPLHSTVRGMKEVERIKVLPDKKKYRKGSDIQLPGRCAGFKKYTIKVGKSEKK